MTGGLPRGLISVTTAAEKGHEHDEDVITKTQNIGRSWKIYKASSNVIGQDAGERLENLFWRLWSNPGLVRITAAETITTLSVSISQGYGRATLPRPRGQLMLADDDATPTPSSPETAIAPPARTSPSQPGHVTSRTLRESPASTPSQSPSKRTGATPDVPPTRPGAQQRRGESSGSATETVSPSSKKPALTRRTSSGGKKRAPFVAATGSRTKTRPAIARRKSSQTTAGPSNDQVKTPTSPVPPVPALPTMQADRQTEVVLAERPSVLAPPPGLPVPSAARTSVFMLPSASSWQSVESGTSPHTSTTSLSSQTPSLLVDRDFRGKFVEQQKRAASHTNLVAAVNRLKKSGSVVRFADERPVDVERRRQDSLRLYSDEQAGEVSRSSAQEGVARPGGLRRGDSNTIIDDDDDSDEKEDEGDNTDDDTGPALPRVRSQLSMMIESRRQSGTLDLEPTPSDQGKGKGKAKKGDSTASKEEELLEMGRKDGVTKAGGLIRSRGPVSTASSADLRYPSPPPPPLFG